MSPLDLIRGPDGNMSGPKLAAVTGHCLMAIGFAKTTWTSGFISELWLTYGTFAIGHAVMDKTGAQVSAFKNKQLDIEAPPSTVVTSTVTTKEVT